MTLQARIREIPLISSRKCMVMCTIHVSCWVASVVLGGTAIALRFQLKRSDPFLLVATYGLFLGEYGVSVWASFPFLLCGLFSIAIIKSENRYLLSWFTVISCLSVICSVAIIVYTSFALEREVQTQTFPRNQVIVAGLTISVNFIELLGSMWSFYICFQFIQCNLKLLPKIRIDASKETNQVRSGAPVSSQEIDPGLVTVMALPPKEATKLFLTLYKPYMKTRPFVNADGFVGGEFHTDIAHQSEQKRSSLPEERRKWKRRHFRRPQSRNDSPDDYENYPGVDGNEDDNDYVMAQRKTNDSYLNDEGQEGLGRNVVNH